MPDFSLGRAPLTPHGLATALSDTRREIARLQRQEAALLSGALPEPGRRPGWPMERLPSKPLALPAPG